jgi:hypothetical protein
MVASARSAVRLAIWRTCEGCAAVSQLGHGGTWDVSVATRNKDLRQSETPTSQVELLKNNDLRRAEVAGEVECPPKMSQRKQERSVTERVADAWKNKRTEKCFTQ